MSYKARLLSRTALPLVAAAGIGVVFNPAAVPNPAMAAQPATLKVAQVNPCAPSNPCAAAPARRAVNPCAPVANPCAAAKPSRAANPCAAGNPCAPAARAANPCAARPAVVGAPARAYDTTSGHRQAPYGDAMPNIVKNYLRAAPYVGTGGVVAHDAFAQLKKLGFKTVINLNTANEGAVAEGQAAKAAGLDYVSLPVAQLAPTAAEVERFSSFINDPNNYPILVHCESSNRVGAMWVLYRAKNGVPPEIAVQEGRTVGLKPSREKAVRQILKLPPLGG